MADVHSQRTRSYNMSQVKGRNTGPEIMVRKLLFANGFRFRLNERKLPGKPDIVLPKYRTVIFVNGCFWHSHKNCNRSSLPKSRTEWWKEKIDKNILNDKKCQFELLQLGYKVITVWQCEIKNADFIVRLIDWINRSL
jgi:DNA mismatch endonuclease, patch repair protein